MGAIQAAEGQLRHLRLLGSDLSPGVFPQTLNHGALAMLHHPFGQARGINSDLAQDFQHNR